MTTLRISGIASGIDTNQYVEDLMRVERLKTDQLIQQKQVATWQKDQFREIIQSVRRFQDRFFNTTNPTTNMTSLSALKRMSVTSSHHDLVSAVANAEAFPGTIQFQVFESAKFASAQSNQMTDPSKGHLLMTDTLQTVSEKLNSSFSFSSGEISFHVNDKEFTFKDTHSLQHVITTINSSNAGVQMKYSSFADSLTISAKETGNGYIRSDNGSNFFSAFGIPMSEEDTNSFHLGEAGRDARFSINGVEGTRSTNAFTIDGVFYRIQGQIDSPSPIITLDVQINAEAIYQSVVQFVDDYNSLLDSFNNRLTQERFRDFNPLTEDQKERMNDRDIAKWEEKAQSGLLRGDPILESMLRSIRETIYSQVNGVHVSQIGIETSRNYRDRGKLILTNNGQNLREAIETSPDRVADLFTARSDISYTPNLSSELRQLRYEESGLAHRLSDVFNQYVRTSRDNHGRKGTLLERAGIEGDISEFRNSFDKQISEIDRRMERLRFVLDRREEQYYRQFAAMEKALQQLHSQGDWLMMQINSSFMST